MVTVCVLGERARNAKENNERLDALAQVSSEIDRRWNNLDAVIYPGAFLRMSENIGASSYAQRADAFAELGYVGPFSEAVKLLSNSPSSYIVAGIDGPRRFRGESDQYCVAFDQRGVAGIGRKVFPYAKVKPGRPPEALFYSSHEGDFGTSDRLITLANGRVAVLLACYDVFGVADITKQADATPSILRVRINGTTLRKPRGKATAPNVVAFNEHSQRCLASWRELLKSNHVSVGIGAIHEFKGAGATSYWQKHGLASCAAALPSGVAIGAAHFEEQLPTHHDRSTLCAARVPRSHLQKGVHRLNYSHKPKDWFSYGDGVALVRLYEI